MVLPFARLSEGFTVALYYSAGKGSAGLLMILLGLVAWTAGAWFGGNLS